MGSGGRRAGCLLLDEPPPPPPLLLFAPRQRAELTRRPTWRPSRLSAPAVLDAENAGERHRAQDSSACKPRKPSVSPWNTV